VKPKLILVNLENLLLAAAGLCVVALGLLITATVLLRSLVGWGVPDDVVIAKELMVGAIVLPLAAVSAARAHIAIEFLYNRFNSKIQAWLLALSSLIGLLVLIPICYAAGRELSHVLAANSYFFGELELPKWPGRLAFFIGIACFVLRMLALLLEDVKAALQPASNATTNSDARQ